MSQSRRFAFMLNSITKSTGRDCLDATRAHVAFWHRTAVSRCARACPRPHGRLMLTVLGGLVIMVARNRSPAPNLLRRSRGARPGIIRCVGQALAPEAIAECIRNGGVWEAESNIDLLDLVSTPPAAD